jgi:hypothetical protein
MSVRVEWDNQERTVILWSFVGRWTWGEFDETIKTMTAMAESVDHSVDLIMDVGQMSILPADMVTHVKSRYLSKARKLERLTAVGVDSHLQFLWNTFTDLPYARHLKLTFFDTLDEARAYLAKPQEK